MLWLAAIAGLSALGCAPERAALAGPRPARVLVVTRSEAPRPGSRSLIDLAFGAEEPSLPLAREADRLLRKRGYATVLAEAINAPTSGPDRLQSTIRSAKADAALVVVLHRLDLSALRTLGRMVIDLDAQLVGSDGRVLWSGEFRGETDVTTYQSRNDWRAHLRDAFNRATRTLP